MTPSRYQREKARAREEAQRWQAEAPERVESWQDLAEAGARFEKLARRFGLLREFRENAII